MKQIVWVALLGVLILPGGVRANEYDDQLLQIAYQIRAELHDRYLQTHVMIQCGGVDQCETVLGLKFGPEIQIGIVKRVDTEKLRRWAIAIRHPKASSPLFIIYNFWKEPPSCQTQNPEA